MLRGFPLLVTLGLLASGLLMSTAEGAFPGTNGRIAFLSTRDGNYEVYVMDADGNNQTRVTTNSDTDGGPEWSADGAEITFYREGPNPPNPINREVFKMDADGSNETNLTNSIPLEYDPVWSPDGSKVAFYGVVGAQGEVFVMDADGGNKTNLTNAPAFDDRMPAWSPDGTQIAFVTDRLGFPFHEIYVMNADGSEQHSITASPGLVASPDWSPDGSKIALSAFVGAFPSGSDEIFVMDADGSNVEQLTSAAGADLEPSWSPDGSMIAFHSSRDGNAEIYVMDADGANQTRITTDAAADVSADWEPVSPDTDGDGLTDAQEIQIFGTDETDADTDGDGCGDGKEVVHTPGAQVKGGRRSALNVNDYFNPSHDGLNRIDDIVLVVDAYFIDDSDGTPGLPPYSPGYSPDTDRTLVGPKLWQLGPPNGLQRVDDIVNILSQYFHDCGPVP